MEYLPCFSNLHSSLGNVWQHLTDATRNKFSRLTGASANVPAVPCLAPTMSLSDPTTVYFTNTLFNAPPIPASVPLPRLPDEPASPTAHFHPLPPSMWMTPDPPLSFIHRHSNHPEPAPVFDPHTAIARNHLFHLKTQWSTSLTAQKGRLMLGLNAQGPPGNGHGGSIAAILDDVIGTTGGTMLIQGHLQGLFRKEEVFKDLPGDGRRYISIALDNYLASDPATRAGFRFHPEAPLEHLQANRDKTIPYSAGEIAFILSFLGGRGHLAQVDGWSSPPVGLVAGFECKLKRRVPLLTRLVTRGRVTKIEGKRIHVTAQIFGKKNTRLTALEPDESGDWDGEWDVLLAEGKGTLAIMYGVDLKTGKPIKAKM